MGASSKTASLLRSPRKRKDDRKGRDDRSSNSQSTTTCTATKWNGGGRWDASGTGSSCLRSPSAVACHEIVRSDQRPSTCLPSQMVDIEAHPVTALVHKCGAEGVACWRWRETGFLLEEIEYVCVGCISRWRRWRLVESDG